MASFYLGPERERWSPRSWDDLVMAASAGLLDETSWVELKKDVPGSSPESNLELARDIASLAVEGGLLVIGIVDKSGKAGDVVGVAGVPALADRVEKVARSTVHPPLQIRPVVLLDPADQQQQRGCVLVSVPISPDAPHMVDERYWGRSSAGKVALADGQVRRLLDERQVDADRAGARLRAWTQSPSVPPNATDAGRLYVVISPRFVRSDRVTALLYQGDNALAKLIQSAADTCRGTGHFDSIATATKYYRGVRSEGFTSADRTGRDPIVEESLVIVEVRDDGEVDALFGRTTAMHDGSRVLSFSSVLDHVDRILQLAELIGDNVGYQGTWDVGLTITDTADAQDSALTFRGAIGAMWDAATYEAATAATQAQLGDDRPAVLRALLLPLARALQVERQHRERLGLP
jgi:hypothetical protein